MSEDFDIEDLLEAPYRKDSSENGSKEKEKSHYSSDDEDRKKRRKRRSHSRSRSRSRSGSRSRRRHRRSKSKSRSRSKERDRKSKYDYERRRKSRSRSKERRRRSPSPQQKKGWVKSRSPTPENEYHLNKEPEDITPEERDRRTVFCMQLARNIRPRDLEEFFSKVGQVSDVRIISDRNSRRSKGIAYVEFTDPSSANLALNLSGQKVLGVPIMVQQTQAEKNRAAAEAEKLKMAKGPTRIYVGSLHFNINETMVKAIFEPFGSIENVQLIYESETGRSKGYGFVQFRDADSAKRAMDQMNGFEVAGRPIKVGPVTERGDSSMSFMDDEEYEKGGIEMNSTSRAALMAKLSQGHNAGLQVPGMQTMGVSGPPSILHPMTGMPIPTASAMVPSPCFMLSNMFDPNKERDEEWHLDIQDDVLDECGKFGPVVHISIDKSSTHGVVYVKCASPDVASQSVKSLHGRWFAGKQIMATMVPLANYHAMFPPAATAYKPLQPSTS